MSSSKLGAIESEYYGDDYTYCPICMIQISKNEKQGCKNCGKSYIEARKEMEDKFAKDMQVEKEAMEKKTDDDDEEGEDRLTQGTIPADLKNVDGVTVSLINAFIIGKLEDLDVAEAPWSSYDELGDSVKDLIRNVAPNYKALETQQKRKMLDNTIRNHIGKPDTICKNLAEFINTGKYE